MTNLISQIAIHFLLVCPELKLLIYLQFIFHNFLFMNKGALAFVRANELRVSDYEFISYYFEPFT